jgi:puromycin-sensitive aminopeptidase
MCRATVFRTLGTNGDEETKIEAKRQFDEHLKGNLIPADLRSAVYSTVLSEADDILLEAFFNLHNTTDLQEEKMRIATSLGSVKNPKHIQKVLDFALSSHVRSQDSITVICCISNNPTVKEGSTMAWDYVKKNWENIYARYSSGFLITRLVKTCASNFANSESAEDVKSFFEKNPCPAAARSIQQALENIDINCKWLCRESDCLKCYLTNESA